ncbi:MAG TPA: hypothetical protein VN397_04915 [Candidatus Methylomirabilis sp.]|nr:hypothetical protein [Candidatus Methylomirabilis sp.]
MRIGLDFHGVVVDNADMKAQRAPYYGASTLTRSMFIKNTAVGRGAHQLSGRQYQALKVDIYWRPRIAHRVMVPVAGALRFMKRLIDEGHALVIISSSSRKHMKIAGRWCAKNGLKVELVGIGMTRIDKSEAARQYNLDVFVDNDLEKLRTLVGVVPKRYLFNGYGEKRVPVNGIAIRVSSWDELYHSLRKLNT